MEDTRELEIDSVTLLTDEGEVECGIVMTTTIEDQEYIALSPFDEQGNFTDEIWMYRFERDHDGGNDHKIIYIEDDEEYELALEAYDEWAEMVEDYE